MLPLSSIIYRKDLIVISKTKSVVVSCDQISECR
uniref:Uncharacterized protein n=1 Tax=Arundo donax TaxID=35708 RepID=A0A0A9C278_ARUDO